MHALSGDLGVRMKLMGKITAARIEKRAMDIKTANIALVTFAHGNLESSPLVFESIPFILLSNTKTC